MEGARDLLRFVLRKVRAKKWMMLSLLIGNVLLMAIACVNPMYSRAILQRTMQEDLRAVQTEEGKYPGTVTVSASLLRKSGAIVNQENFLAAEEIAQTMDDRLQIPFREQVTEYTIHNVQVTSRALREDDRAGKYLNLAFLSDLEEHGALLAGEWPAAQTDDGVIDVVVSERGMLNMNLLVGEILDTEDLTAPDGSPLSLRVSGVFAASEADDPYWVVSPSGYSGTVLMDEGLFRELFVHFGPDQSVDLSGTWYALMEYAQMDSDRAEDYIEAMEDAQRAFPDSGSNVEIVNNFTDVLREFLQEGKRVSVTLLVLQAPILALLAVFIFMVSRQWVEMEAGEIAVLKSRGAGGGQILSIYLLQSALLAGMGLALGLPLSLFLCQVLGSANAFLEFVSRAALPARVDARVVLFGVGAALLSILTMVLPAMRAARTSVVRQRRERRAVRRRLPLWQKACLDLILLAISLYGLYSFSAQREELYRRVLSGDTLDPLLFLSASLFILGAALLGLRLLPLFVRLIYNIGRRWWSSALFASFLQVFRTRGSQGFLMVFLMVTVALGIFNATAARTIEDNAERNTRYAIGADVVLQEAWRDNQVAAAASSGPESAQSASTEAEPVRYVEPEYEGYALLPEAESVTRVLNDDDIRLTLPDGALLRGVRLLGIHTKEFGETAWFDEDLLPIHWYNYLNAISQNAEAILVSENFQDLGFRLGDAVNYRNSAGDSARGIIYGFVPYFPTYSETVTTVGSDGQIRTEPSYLIVAHLSQVQAAFGVTPYEIWMKVQGDSTQFLYDYIEETGKQIRSFRDAQAERIERKNDPVYQGTNGILTVGFIVALLLCTVGFLLYWVLSIRQRALQMGIFRAMGMSMREIVTMLLNEQIFVSLLSVAAGAGIGGAAAALFVPLIQIAYAAEQQMVPLRLVLQGSDCARLFGVVGAVMGICLCVLGVLVARLKIARALKLGEDA